MTHLIFAPTGTLKIRSKAYHAVHRDLRRWVAKKRRRAAKRK